MPFAAAVSEHPVASHAVGEVVGQVLEAVGEAPGLASLFVGAAHTGTIEDIAAAVQRILRPRTLIGCTTGTVVGGAREIEDAPALALWAATPGWATPVRLLTEHGPDGATISGFPADDLPADAAGLVLLGDPFSFPAEQFLAGLRDQVGVDLPVVGGLASGGRGPGGTRLVLNYQVVADGAVGVVVGGVGLDLVVSQGCRPIGDPLVVTRADGRLIHELAGRPALERVEQLVAALGPDELAMAQQGLHIGRVVDERKVDYARGDFLVRNVLGGDRSAGAIAVGDEVEVGATVQFQVRDAHSADEDLRALLTGRSADGALLFTCNGRGSALFGTPHHDATLVEGHTRRGAVAGMSAAGEIGPVGDRSFLHGFTASVALFRED